MLREQYLFQLAKLMENVIATKELSVNFWLLCIKISYKAIKLTDCNLANILSHKYMILFV